MKKRFILPNAFDPERELVPTPGFRAKVEALRQAGRYRSAIEEILKVLDCDPNNYEALYHAATIIGLEQTKQLTAAEPLGQRYTLDQRLNPVWAVCQECDNQWVPSSVYLGSLMGVASIGNPVGLQCPNCGYTLCRECLNRVSFYEHDCPQGCGLRLTAPVLPTGRNNYQYARRKELVTHVFIFREGPIQPDANYVQAFLDTRSPDVFEGRPEVVALSVERWPDGGFEDYVISSLMARGITADMIQNSESGTIVDDYGSRVHLIKLYATSRRPYLVRVHRTT